MSKKAKTLLSIAGAMATLAILGCGSAAPGTPAPSAGSNEDPSQSDGGSSTADGGAPDADQIPIFIVDGGESTEDGGAPKPAALSCPFFAVQKNGSGWALYNQGSACNSAIW